MHIFSVIHFVYNFFPVGVFNEARLYLLTHLVNLTFAFKVVFFSNKDLEEVGKGFLNMHLDESKFFIAFIL